MAGLRAKKLTGLKLTLRISQGITGKSSMRGTWERVLEGGLGRWLVWVGGLGVRWRVKEGVTGETYVVDSELDEDY